MKTKKKKSEIKLLEQYQITLKSMTKQDLIAKMMREFGYDAETIAQGKKFLAQAQAAYQNNKTKKHESFLAYNHFTTTQAELAHDYALHRKKAKIIFSQAHQAAIALDLKHAIPRAYAAWLSAIERFYTTLSTDETLSAPLAQLKLTNEQLTTALHKIAVLKKAKVDYMNQKAMSQNATQVKNEAFDQVNAWMSRLYAIARIALKDHPQLLEVLT